MFIPPLNMGQFQPSPATMSQWIYQIWQFLQENPIATETEIREFIQSELTQSETLGNAIEDYLTENPPPAPVQSVQGKTGAVNLAYNDIVTSSNAVPVYKAASTPSTNTLTGQYNLGYRLFVNTTTQEIFTISSAGALSLVGRGKFDGTTVDLNSADGDTTINEAVTANDAAISTLETTVQKETITEITATVPLDNSGVLNLTSVVSNDMTLIDVRVPSLTAIMFIPLKYATGKWFAKGVNWETFQGYTQSTTSDVSAVIHYISHGVTP